MPTVRSVPAMPARPPPGMFKITIWLGSVVL